LSTEGHCAATTTTNNQNVVTGSKRGGGNFEGAIAGKGVYSVPTGIGDGAPSGGNPTAASHQHLQNTAHDKPLPLIIQVVVSIFNAVAVP
jgi:hypothetical protein